jgi:ABC-type amino acid transport substrate-binding protein
VPDEGDLPWRRSSYCSANGCVEVAAASGEAVAVRDSKLRDSPVLTYTRQEWAAFIAGVKSGEFDAFA